MNDAPDISVLTCAWDLANSGWVTGSDGKTNVQGWERDGLRCEVHTRFAHYVRVTDAERYAFALKHGDGAKGSHLLLVHDDAYDAHLPLIKVAVDPFAIADGRLRIEVFSYYGGNWTQELLFPRPNPDFARAADIVRSEAERAFGKAWAKGVAVFHRGLRVPRRILWRQEGLLPLVLSACSRSVAVGLTDDCGMTSGARLASCCVRDPSMLREDLSRLFASSVPKGGDLHLELGFGEQELDRLCPSAGRNLNLAALGYVGSLS